ncbi:MAG TPA: 5-formyltetrahydrofolate cyclo-ligase [Woeseiaceae bacterium]|nr:5-formyltetrahydrofolate cyclo-ligase [Woeseiaceae bacterium]
MNRRQDAIASARRAAKSARRALSPDYREAASRVISSRVQRMHEFNACTSLACYLPMPDEVDATPVIARAWEMGKRVFAPIIDRNGSMVFSELTPQTELRQNWYGLWEPESGSQIPARELDLVITPLVAFDENGHRIGMGSAYFDRCFAFLRNRHRWLRPKLIGTAFNCQQVEKIKPNPWDIPLYKVVTEHL